MNPEERGTEDTAPLDKIRTALDRTRETRMLLYMLTFSLPPEVATAEINNALDDLENRVSDADRKALRELGSGQYYIVAPVSALRPPSPEDLAKITTALTALDDLGLLIETL